MKIVYSILIILFLTTPTLADWSKKDTAYQAAYTVLHIVDWGQARHISNSDKFSEDNYILGNHPSTGEVNTYFALTLLGHTAISYILPPKYRRYWQIGTIVGQGAVVGRNFHIGVRVNF